MIEFMASRFLVRAYREGKKNVRLADHIGCGSISKLLFGVWPFLLVVSVEVDFHK